MNRNNEELILNGMYARFKKGEFWKKCVLLSHFVQMVLA